MDVRGVLVAAQASQAPQSAPEPVRIGHRTSDHSAWAQHACDLGDEPVRVMKVLEQLCRDDDVEGAVGEWEGLLRIGPHRFDPKERHGFGERAPVDIESHYLVVPARLRDDGGARSERRLPRQILRLDG